MINKNVIVVWYQTKASDGRYVQDSFFADLHCSPDMAIDSIVNTRSEYKVHAIYLMFPDGTTEELTLKLAEGSLHLVIIDGELVIQNERDNMAEDEEVDGED